MVLRRDGDALDQVASGVAELCCLLVRPAHGETDAAVTAGEHFTEGDAHILSLIIGYAGRLGLHVERVNFDDGVVVPVELEVGEAGFEAGDDDAGDVLTFEIAGEAL